jgi:hypothetical protein
MILGKSTIQGRVIELVLPVPFTTRMRHGTFTTISEPVSEENTDHRVVLLVNDVDMTIDVTLQDEPFDLLASWQGLAESATAHFGHYDEAWHQQRAALDQRTRRFLVREEEREEGEQAVS